MEEYEFRSHWSSMETLPTNATRCLVTDGDLVITATYLVDSFLQHVWIFSDVDHKENFNIIGWMPLPRPMPKPAVVEDIVNEKPISKRVVKE
jgi:hypothetical protein